MLGGIATARLNPGHNGKGDSWKVSSVEYMSHVLILVIMERVILRSLQLLGMEILCLNPGHNGKGDSIYREFSLVFAHLS